MEARYALPGSGRYRRIRAGILLTGLSIFAQLYFFQPILGGLTSAFSIEGASASLTVSMGTVGMSIGLFTAVFAGDLIGRRRLMVVSMLVSSVVTIAHVLVGSYPLLLALCLVKGVVLSGVSAVALPYLTEEIAPQRLGQVIAVYLSGNTIGGMGGRVLSIFASNWGGWQASALAIGGISLLLGIVFTLIFPASQNFTPQRVSAQVRFRRMRVFLSTPYFIALYAIGAAIMGVFVSVYNYLSFLLEGPAYRLPHYLVALIFLMYMVGVAGSMVVGRLSDRREPTVLLRECLVLYLFGVALMSIPTLPTVIGGLGVHTFAFFACHTLASRLVSTHAGIGKTSATCLYWLVYYLGSSAVGYLTGLVYFRWGWLAFTGVIALLLAGALVVAWRYVGRGAAVPALE